ncbi:MAG: DUF790 family protein [Halobacteriales archaeon]|nr:DUF790 family protein [Halobacteriales archaeon]
MLTKELLRVSRAGGGYHPQLASAEDEQLAARAIGIYQGHVGESKGDLEAAMTELEREARDFKLVRGFAKLLDRNATFEVEAPIDPPKARAVVFETAAEIGVITEDDRTRALERAGDRLGIEPTALGTSLYADLDERQILTEFDSAWSPAELIDRYNLSLAQTALFDATEIDVRSSDPKALVSAVKRLGLMYEIHQTADGRVVEITGPDALFRRTRRYGTRFARLLRTVVKATEWSLEATIDDRGTERTLTLDDEDPLVVPDTEPLEEMTFDSGVEADFATRFSNLELDWTLQREPEPLAAGARVMIPDFAFDYDHADFRVFFEIMGFWTPEYVEKKLAQLETLEDVDMIVAVDESLGVGEAIEARDHRVIEYDGTVRLKALRDVLRAYEDELVAEAAATLPDELVPDVDVVTIDELAADYGVSEAAIEDKPTPDHERIGRTLVRPTVLDTLADRIEPGMSLDTVESVLEEFDLSETSAVLSALGYRIEWTDLSDGVVRATD